MALEHKKLLISAAAEAQIESFIKTIHWHLSSIVTLLFC